MPFSAKTDGQLRLNRGKRLEVPTALFAVLVKYAVRTDSGCLEWRRGCTDDGYGQYRYAGRIEYVHRLAYAAVKGVVPAAMEVCHHCDNPPCFDAEHLFLAPHALNMRDAHLKGRAIFGPIVRNPPRGEGHPHARLTEDAVRDIRRRHAVGISLADLAREFGIGVPTVHNAVHRVTWKHVE